MENLKARRAWTDILQTLRDYSYQPRLLYLAKLSITVEGATKIFHEKFKFKQYLPSIPAIQEALEGKIQPKEVYYTLEN